MRRLFLIAAIILSCIISISSFYFIKSKNTPQFFTAEVDNDEKPDNEFSKAMEEEAALLKDPKTGKIPAGMRELELKQATEILNSQLSRTYNSSKVEAANYTYQGPSNLGGRTRALTFDISDATGNTMIAGSVSGGVFKTTDGGTTWVRVNTSNQHYSITSIAQDPRPGFQNIWYYCGGENLGNSASENFAFYLGDGIYKSIDGGNTWNKLNSSNPGSTFSFDNLADLITTIAVNPVNGDVYAACAASIMRSQDGGVNWTTIQSVSNTFFGSLDNTWITDVVITTSGRIYTAFSGSNPGNLDGVWTSLSGDAGTFTHISGTTSASNPAGWNSYGGYGRIVLALAPSNQNLLFVLYDNNIQSSCSTPSVEAEFYKWNQSTNTWTDLSSTLPDEPGCKSGNDPFAVQGGYDMCIAIKPDDANTIFIGGSNAYRSTNGGTSWTRIGGYANATSYALYPNHHSDIHTMKFSPASNTKLYSGDDGGLQWGDITAGSVTWTPINNDYRTYQYYHVAIKQEAGVNDFLGGAQDNGTTNAIGGTSNMTSIFSGDGASVGFGAGATNYKQYVSVNSGTIVRRNVSLAPSGIEADLTPTNVASIFVTYFYLDPDNTENLYYAGVIPHASPTPPDYKLLRIKNASTAINTSWATFGFNFNGYIRSMVTTRGTYSNSSRLYIGTDNAKVYRLNDPVNAAAASAVPTDITPPGIANQSTVIGMAVNPQNQEELLIVCSNYNIVHAFYTANAGSATPTWNNVEGNLNYPSYRSCMILNTSSGNEYYVGTSVGLFKTTLMNGTSTVWTQEAVSEIGNAVVTSLDLRTADNTFAIGTHGLGMWKGTATTVLPVQFENFSGQLINNNAYLKWTTSREINNRGFDIERSYDGGQFKKIGFVTGSGPGYNYNSFSYNFIDTEIGQEYNYYRLKQIDISGKSIYSPIILLKSDIPGNTGMKVLGNPFTNYLDVLLPKTRSGNLLITLTDMSGKLVLKTQYNDALTRIRINTGNLNLTKGMYVLKIADGNKQYITKVYKD